MKRTGIKRGPSKRRKAPSELTRCDFWTPHLNGNPSRCSRQGFIVVDEDERYCKTHATERADKLVGDLVKLRDGYECVLRDFNDEPCMGVLSACHLIPKGRYGATRWVQRNIVVGCASHHMAFDQAPLEKEVWITHYLGADVYDALKLVAVGGAKYDPAAVILKYRESA